jgi:hypothetical protein
MPEAEIIQALNGISWPGALVLCAAALSAAYVAGAFIRRMF